MGHDDQRRPGRPRSAETDERIVAATLDLIRGHGPEAVNVASVATRSGVARTTIYRRFRDRQELLRAALGPVTSRGGPPEDVSVRAKLLWTLVQTEEVLARSIGPGGVAALVTDSDADFSAALRDSLRTALEPLGRQIRDDVARGRLASYVDADVLLNLVLGAYLAEVLRHGHPRSGWRERTADLLAAAFAPATADPAGPAHA